MSSSTVLRLYLDLCTNCEILLRYNKHISQRGRTKLGAFGTGWNIVDDNSNQVAKFIGSAANEYLRQDNVYTPTANKKYRLQV